MNALKNFFWNAEEKRIRAAFRFIGFMLLISAFFPLRRYLLQPFLNELPFGELISILVFLSLFLFIIWLTTRFIDKRSMGSIGFNIDREWWINFAFGLFLGAFLLSFVFLFELAFGWIEITGMFYVTTDNSYGAEMIAGFLLYISVGIREETISRGYLIKNLSEGFNLKKSNPVIVILLVSVFTSVMFGLGHANNQSATLISTWNIMVIGMILAYSYIASGSLALPIGLHITWNFFQGCVYGFPVSGHPVRVSLFRINQLGDDMWTGGSFGPEAGLVIYFASIIGFLMIYNWLKVRKGGASLRVEIAEYKP